MYPDDPAAVSAIHSSVECLQSEDISAAVQCNTILQYNNAIIQHTWHQVRYVLSCPPHMMVHDILIRPTQQRF